MEKNNEKENFNEKREKWINSWNTNDENSKLVSVAFDYELDKNGPRSYLIEEEKLGDISPKSIDSELDPRADL